MAIRQRLINVWIFNILQSDQIAANSIFAEGLHSDDFYNALHPNGADAGVSYLDMNQE